MQTTIRRRIRGSHRMTLRRPVRWASRGKDEGSVDSATIGATEDAASRRPARPGDSRLHSVRASKTVFLVNPASNGGATGKRWPELAHRAEGLGLAGETLFSERPGHLIDLARQAVDGGAALVVAVGGDGTLNEVVNGIAGADVELATI